jgi:hypothetical protein
MDRFRINDLALLVKRMREAQRDYFGLRGGKNMGASHELAKQALRKAQKLEHEVDQLIALYWAEAAKWDSLADDIDREPVQMAWTPDEILKREG